MEHTQTTFAKLRKEHTHPQEIGPDCPACHKIQSAVNSHEALIAQLNSLISALGSVRANVDGPNKALKGSWYALDSMLSADITETRKLIAQTESTFRA